MAAGADSSAATRAAAPASPAGPGAGGSAVRDWRSSAASKHQGPGPGNRADRRTVRPRGRRFAADGVPGTAAAGPWPGAPSAGPSPPVRAARHGQDGPPRLDAERAGNEGADDGWSTRGVPSRRTGAARSGWSCGCPPPPTQLPAVRAMAGDLAMRMDYDLDSVEDLRLAVDEACATLAPIAGRRRAADRGLRDHPRRACTSRPGCRRAEGTDVPQDGFGWAVLQTLVDAVDGPPRDAGRGPRRRTARATPVGRHRDGQVPARSAPERVRDAARGRTSRSPGEPVARHRPRRPS